jgi:hypothetical protein
MVEKISMNVNETLELDYLVEKVNDDKIEITEEPSSDSISLDYIATRKGILNPLETGTYKLNIDGQTVEIEVTDIPDSVVAQSDLVAWFPMENGAQDETAGDTSYGDSTDYSGSVNGATKQSSGGVTDILTQSTDSGVFSFDGAGDDIDLGAIYKSDPITTSAWVNIQTDSPGYIFSLSNRYDLAYDQFLNNGTYEFRSYDGSSAIRLDSGVSTTSSYVHLAVTSDGSTITFYANGSEVASYTGSPAFPIGSWRVGEQSNGGNNISALIDDVRIYNAALTSTQINDAYNAAKP